MRMISGISVLLTFALFHSNAIAQCSKDTDCKGDRICQGGDCIDPTMSKPSDNAVAETVDDKEKKAQEEYERVKAALPEFNHESDYQAYSRTVAMGRTHLSFIDYKNLRIQKYRRHGIARLVIGSTFLAGSIAMFAVFAKGTIDKRKNESMSDDSWFWTIYVAPCFAAIGVPVLVSGIYRAAMSKRMIEGMQSLETAAKSTPTIAQRFAIAPMISGRSSSLGLAAIYYF